MSFTVFVHPNALWDADRLDQWLKARDLQAAARLGDLLEQAIASLAKHPLRGRPISRTIHEINIPFGRSAYIVRYRVSGQQVTVTRIWHSLEQR